ncbi:dTMP kinase [Candidatus Uabimicrobium sp. HlEnr_7]|uniref:dTMP kinase n=1 Tax=Candidatus Uabimicrobium helgolandensis TaxID=3095367 RepID=UPI003558EE27
MKIIALEGIDGTGKTTIFEKLKSYFHGDSSVVFAKSPPPPFDQIIPDFWEKPKLERFLFFLTANMYFCSKKSDGKIYVLDRFIFSTYVTHIVSLSDKQVLKSLLDEINVPKPSKTYLIKSSLTTIKERLDERNNEIDNKLRSDRAYFRMLYDQYYSKQDVDLGEVETLKNETWEDFELSVDIIKRDIETMKGK